MKLQFFGGNIDPFAKAHSEVDQLFITIDKERELLINHREDGSLDITLLKGKIRLHQGTNNQYTIDKNDD